MRKRLSPDDEAEIRAVALGQGETWIRHDAKAYGALFTEDCDVVNVVGWWWKGRAELESKLVAGFVYGGHWLIAGFQNTHGVPEQPFPTRPPPPSDTGAM